jgi:diguanylate cyclase (GGDEF)-like protein
MMQWVLRFLFPADSPREQREQITGIFESLRRQIPLLYGVALVNLLGLHVATHGGELRWFSPLTILSAILLWRMIYWIAFQKPSENFARIKRELVTMVLFTTILCLGFSIWAQSLITAYPSETMTILLYSVLAALGVAYGLSSFPRAALLPLLILGLPVAIRLFWMGKPSDRGIALSLIFVLALFIWQLHVHNRALLGLVRGQLAIARERNRAVEAELQATKRADEDVLSGIANRGKLVREIEKGMVRGPLTGGGSVLAICDLDGFKSANDAFGHAAGDEILREYARRLKDAFGAEALVARLGGDEFSVFWKDGLSRPGLEAASTHICELASQPVLWDGKELFVGASCGVTEAGPYTWSDEEFFRQADSALYKAKASSRGHWHLYDLPQFEADQRRAKIEKSILSGEALREMEVHFQPIFDLKEGVPLFAEALARWNNAELGAVSPDEFIRISEKLGVIDRLNERLLEMALASAETWPANLSLSFNLSAMQLSRSGASDKLQKIVSASSFHAHRVQFEITETAILADLGHAEQELAKLSQYGFTSALDDFGSGYASVAYLRELSFDTIKLDGSLMDNIIHSERSRQILSGLVDLCHSAGARCVAEHIETHEQLKMARALGCDYGQGFFLGKPATSERMLKALYSNLGSSPS